MCGLLGYIGTSKDQNKTQELVTALFDKTQSRGIDAAGFYCVSEFDSNKVYYHKQPGPSIDLIKENVFKNLWSNSTNLGLFHCRAASTGVGVPAENINNHPFVSEDLSKAVIHNGVINKNEWSYLKNFYQTKSNCDSEIILRILEQEDHSYLENLSFFLSSSQESHFSVAYTQNNQNERKLTLFRNKQRPLFFVDLTDELGQIFFFSTEQIFFSSLEEIGRKNIFINSNKITEIKPNEIYEFVYKKNHDIKTYLYDTKNEKIIADEPKVYYSINNNVNKKFQINNGNDQLLNTYEHLFDCIIKMQVEQTNFLNNIFSLIRNKNINCDQYELVLSTIKEINKKLNYINFKNTGNNYEL